MVEWDGDSFYQIQHIGIQFPVDTAIEIAEGNGNTIFKTGAVCQAIAAFNTAIGALWPAIGTGLNSTRFQCSASTCCSFLCKHLPAQQQHER